MVNNPPANAGDTENTGSIAGSERSPGGRNGDPLHYSCLENPMDRGAWQATVPGVLKSQAWLSDWANRHIKKKKEKKKLRYIKWNTHNYTDCNFKKKKPILAGSQVSLISTQQCFWNNLWILLNFQVTKWFTIFSYIFFLPKMSWGDNYPPFYELHY